MADAVRDVMSKDLTSVEPGDSVADAASKMAQSDIGVVLVLDGDELKGLLTDRDVVVRVVAEGKEADDVKVEEIVTAEVRTLEPDASVDDALRTMREAKVRRLPVVEDGKPVGIVSLGDVAEEREPESALGEISGASPGGGERTSGNGSDDDESEGRGDDGDDERDDDNGSGSNRGDDGDRDDDGRSNGERDKDK